MVLADRVAEVFTIERCGPSESAGMVVHVLPKPGVTDPEAESARTILNEFGFAVEDCRTVRSYRIDGPTAGLPRLIDKVLANEAVERSIVGPILLDRLSQGHPYKFRLIHVPIRGMDDAALLA